MQTVTPHADLCNLLVEKDAADFDEKLARLEDSNPQFKLAWKRKRRVQDQSAGAFQRVLVGFAVNDGWTDQEIRTMLIKWRQKHKESFKEDPKFYAAIIAQVRAAEERKDVLSADVSAELPREEALARLSTLLGVDITSIQRFHTDPRSYVMRLQNGSYIEFKTRGDLLEQSKLAGALFDYANIIMPSFKAAEWTNVKALILASIEDVDAADEATHLGSCLEWLKTYIRKHLRADNERDGQLNAAVQGKPALLGGKVWFQMEGFRRSIMLEASMLPPPAALLSVRLRQIGCEYKPQVALRPSGEPNTTRSMWRVPDDFKLDGDGDVLPP